MSERQPEPEVAPPPPQRGYSDLYPLDEFYTSHGLSLPVIARVEPDEVPDPYRSLLVHRRDMTSTLEKFHKHKIHIHATARRVSDNDYFREVVLELDRSDKPVEFGAIKISLDLFPPDAREEILREQLPLGRILAGYQIAIISQPRAYLRVASDAHINKALKLDGACFLYGRRNSLVDGWGRSLAEIVEILPP